MNVVFEEERSIAPAASLGPRRSFAGRLVSWGLAKDERSANMLLIGTAAFCIVASVGIWLFLGSAPEGPTYEELIEMQRREGV